MDNLFGALFGKIDENKQYFTEEMFKNEAGHFALYILLRKNLVSQEEYDGYKKEYMRGRNRGIIKELQELKKAP